jgi:hypothetical protein
MTVGDSPILPEPWTPLRQHDSHTEGTRQHRCRVGYHTVCIGTWRAVARLRLKRPVEAVVTLG